MPLPPAPTKRAAMLPPEAYDAPARSSHKAARKSESPAQESLLAEHPQAEDDFDPRAGGGDVATGAYAGDIETYLDEPQPVRKKNVTVPAPTPKKKKSTGPAKMFVLDTNVLMHDPMSLFRFEEHDIFLPMIVLEELDGHKKGMTEVARNARQVSRSLDALAGSDGADIAQGL
jgi:PhoH-like ATPase